MHARPLQVLRNLINLKREQWMDPDSLKALQEKKLIGILNSAAKTQYYSGISADSLEEIPMTLKDDVRDSEHSFIPKDADHSSLRITRTSGSTGRPIKVFKDQAALDQVVALKYLVETEFGLSVRDLFAEVSISKYEPHSLLRSLGLFKKIVFPISNGEEKNFSLIRKSRANVMGWYPSVMSLLAQINDNIRMKSVFCGGEMLTDECRKLIGDSFSCPVFNQYATMEFASIAWECPDEHKLHVNSSSCIVEAVDSQGKPTSGTGELLVTTLFNHTMPLLRFNIGDMGKIGKECPCGRGFPLLENLKGRRDDFIVLPSGKKLSSFSLNILYLETSINGIWHYQIIQETPETFVVRIVPTKDGFDDRSKKEVARRIRNACLGEQVNVEFELVDSIKRDKSGKLRKIVSRVR
jgi:phenylacetate-CoA ligase